MKLLAVPAILLALLPGSAPVRFEAGGVRVGNDLVSEKIISLKTAGELPILVSGSTLENLSSTNKALEVAIGDKSVLLDVGLRLDRQGEGYRLSTHGPSFTLEAGGKTLTSREAASFKVTEKGFDFGALGALEGGSLAAKIATVLVLDPRTPSDPAGALGRVVHALPPIRPPDHPTLRFGQGNPSTWSQSSEYQNRQMLEHVSKTKLP